MRIIGLINKNSGPGFHRIHMPLLTMNGPDVYITNSVEEKDFEKGCDAIYYNRIISDEILALQKKYHFKIVVDVDDWWELDPHHIMYDYHIENKMQYHQEKHLQLADVVTCTHERLAEKVYPFNKNVVVIPNAIPKHEYFPVEKTVAATNSFGKKPLRVFWQGSVTHEADINLLRNPLKRLDKSKFLMVIAGFMEEEDAWHRMVSSYTNGLNLKGVIMPGLPPHLYYSNYKYADVCVAPLLDSPFNSMKSNLKVLEAAHSGLPVIASAVHPYLDLPVLQVKKQSDWYKWLNDTEAQKENAIELSEFVKANYDYDTINEKRREVFYG